MSRATSPVSEAAQDLIAGQGDQGSPRADILRAFDRCRVTIAAPACDGGGAFAGYDQLEFFGVTPSGPVQVRASVIEELPIGQRVAYVATPAGERDHVLARGVGLTLTGHPVR